ncbi:integral membrane protein [Nannizzia gypsea CBS 118893]|uniref:Integral membrane protein n=1 Tax=Arthroderma gypseum (strain ATCC MYA-4604 / CBS 118893) TaxID=535722 RepID=E5QZG9_ARTGP|nr:integral membrane protein [Nannizzia gypsea CBS 118893]EFQ98974.1 integral membrane protein [Nannizzia gypsea CBS 118893]
MNLLSIFTLFSVISVALGYPLTVTPQLAPRDQGLVAPQCAVDCQLQVVPTRCSTKDTACLCADEAYQAEVGSCVMANCTSSEALMAKYLGSRACNIPIVPLYPVVDAGTLVPFLAATLFITFRIASKLLHLGSNWGVDDFTIIVAYILAVAVYSIHASMIYYGFGKNIWDIIPQEHITVAFKLFFAYALAYKALISLAKISVGLFLLRIFQSKGFRFLMTTIIVLNGAIAVTWILVDTFRCIPVHLAWTGWKMDEPGKCIDFMTATYVNGFVNITVDTIMVSLPMYEVLKLKLSWRKKVSVMVMLVMGLFVTAIAIVRVVVLFQHDPTKNPTYEMEPLIYWSMIECQVAVICACLPATRVLLLHFAPGALGPPTENESKKSNNSSSNSQPREQPTSDSATLIEQGDGISKTVTYSVDSAVKSQASTSGPCINMVDIDTRTK